ncbi:hypothetical protein D3C71_25720 [compost metagenome]
MKLEITTSEEARNAAKALRSHLKTKADLTLGVGHSQEVLSAMLGLPNWDTLKGVVAKAEAVAPGAPAALPCIKQARTLYIDAYATGDGDGPTWARIVVDTDFLQQLTRLHAAAQAAKASEIRTWLEPDAWDGEESSSFLESELVVLPGGAFWFRFDVKHADYHVETRGMTIEELLHQLAEAQKNGDEYLFHGPDIPSLKERLDDCDELLFCDECGVPYSAGGDGYDGKCPSCADKAEEGHQDD